MTRNVPILEQILSSAPNGKTAAGLATLGTHRVRAIDVRHRAVPLCRSLRSIRPSRPAVLGGCAGLETRFVAGRGPKTLPPDSLASAIGILVRALKKKPAGA